MRAYLQLLRLPTVFTAMADILLGFLLTHRYLYGPFPAPVEEPIVEIGWHDPQHFVCLLLASACLYLSGMVFNDVFDVKQDLIERPGRPIPSGRVSRKSATLLGIFLMLAGIAFAATVCRISLEVSLVLAVMILAYDGVFKRTVLGPVAMGSCRFLNVLLGASVQTDWSSLLTHPQLGAATGLGIYIVGVTLFAKTEARTSSRWQLGFAQLVINVGFAVLVALVLTGMNKSPKEIPLAMLIVIAFSVNRRATAAINNPAPKVVQAGIKVMLLSLVLIDATLIFWFLNTPDNAGYGAVHALVTASLVIPAMILSRLIPMT